MQFNAEKSLNNGNISQSYSQCVERISGIKDIFDFKVPEEVVRVRETRWDDFFERYSKEPCDDIDLNVDILEPGGEEEESEEDNSFEQRLPVRVSSGLIQYWINTGNLPPCNRLLLPDGNVLLESGSSLSEKELSSLPERNADGRQKSKTDSSSVDTAVYILSNANVTKRADTIAIIAGVNNNVKVADCNSVETTKNAPNSKITCTVDHIVRSDKDITIQNSDFYSLSTVIASTITHNQLHNNADITDNIDLQSKEILSCESTGKVNKPSQESAKTDEISDGLAPNEVLERDSLCKVQSSINVTNEEENTNPSFHRKKLYTGRDSPIDLLQTKVHSINRLSKITDVLHPALTPNDIVKKKSSKCKSKSLSLFNEHFLNSDASQRLLKPVKKKVRKKRSSVKNIAGKKVTNKIRDSDRFPKYPPESRDPGKRDSTRPRGRNDTDISTKDKTSKPDLTSVNLNPVVVLTRSRLCNSKCVGDVNAHENIMRDNGRSHETEKLRARAVENLDEETTIESDDNTVILICECKTSASLGTLFSDNCAAKSRVSGKRVTGQKTVVKKTRSSNSCGEGATSDVKLRELRVMLERLSPSTLKNHTSAVKSSGVSRKGNTVRQKVASTTKLPEAKVMLERLPSDVYQKRGYNSATRKNSSISPDNANNRENRNNRRKYAIISSSDENSEPTRPPRKRSKTSANASGKTRDVVRRLHGKTVLDGSEKNTETCKDEARLSTSESNNNNPGKVNGNEKRSPFFGYSADANDDASYSDTTEKNGTRCKDDVGIVLFQTKTYETDSSDSEIYNPRSARGSFSGRRVWVDSSSSSSPGKEQRAVGTRSTSSKSATGEEESHDIDNFDITDSNKVQSMSLPKETSRPFYRDSLVNISRKKEQFDRSEMVKVSQRNNVKSTAVKSLVFQTKTYYDSDSSE